MRFHIVDDEEHVVLLDTHTQQVLEISVRDWHILEQADGSRDLDALCLAATRLGFYRGESEIRQLLEELDDAGVLDDGLPHITRAPPVPVDRSPKDRPLEPLPGFRLYCDGRGTCCRAYGSVPFLPEEALRARVHAQDASLPIARSLLFAPLRGAQRDDASEPFAVALVQGRCAFLNLNNLCDLHSALGHDKKPFACQAYPAVYVDDGVAIRVSPTPECACIFDSAGGHRGSGLVSPGATRREHLHEMVEPRPVPDPVPLTERHATDRAALRCWSVSVHRRLLGEREPDLDAPGFALAMAAAMADGALSADVAPTSLEALRPWVQAFRSRAEDVAETQDAWRGASDLSRHVARWISDALRDADVFAAPPRPETERFYLASLAWGHRVATGGRTLAHGLRDRATRMLVARAMASSPSRPAALSHPLALLEAAVRNLGITGYADELDSR